jgi:hypothetical protein
MHKHSVISLLLSLSLAACGGSSQSATTTPSNGTTTTTTASAGGEQHAEHHGEHQGGHHPQLSPAQHAMHEVLAPIWHAEASPARNTRACEQAASLRTHAENVQREAAPADAPANTAEVRAALVTATAALVDDCAAGGANVPAKLADVHTAFHHVFERR